MAKILIVEDEVHIARFEELELKHEGYEVEVTHDGITGLEKALQPDVDLVLLDVMLPGMSGTDLCAKLRETSEVPVIMVTARDDVSDKVLGLDIGADDYVTKPFITEELLARIRMVLSRRRGVIRKQDADEILKHSGLVIDTKKRTVLYAEDEIYLTKKEFDLLSYLIKNKNQVKTRDELLSEVWEYDYVGETNIVDVYVRYLRQKIENKYNIHLIDTIRGVGYIVRED